MKNLALAICAAAICSTGVAAAPKDDVPVTIIGCVHDGHNGTFVFTNVVDLNESATAPTSALYWLSTTRGLKEHVGHKVEVNGTYSPSRDKGKTARIKIETDADEGELKVAVENGMKRAELQEPIAATPVGTAGAGIEGTAGTTGIVTPAGVDSKLEIVKPYRRLEVKNIRMISASCR